MCPESQPTISVIMPVFNGGPFLDRSIRSLRAQTFPHWELLAVDDGSTDHSYDLLCRYRAADSRVCPFRLAENRGASAARNHALVRARGVSIAYLDCDDEYDPGFLGQVDALQDRADVLVFNYELVEERIFGMIVTTLWDPSLVRATMMERNMSVPLGVAHRRSLLDTVGLFDEARDFEEDFDLWKRFARAGAKFFFVPRSSGRYHVRSNSLARIRNRAAQGTRERPRPPA